MIRVAPATLPSGEDGGSKRKEAPNEGPRACRGDVWMPCAREGQGPLGNARETKSRRGDIHRMWRRLQITNAEVEQHVRILIYSGFDERFFIGTYEKPIDIINEEGKIAALTLQLISVFLGDTSQAGFGAT